MNIMAVVKAFAVQSAGAALLLISLMPVLSLCTAGSLLCANGTPDPLAWVAFGAGLMLIGLGTWMFIQMVKRPQDIAVSDGADVAGEVSPVPPSPALSSEENEPEAKAAAEPEPAAMPGRRRSITASAMAEAD